MLEDIKGVTVFSTALCNLNCEYCYICKDKEGNLKSIDNDLKEEWSNNVYLKRLIELEPNIASQINMVEIWGGEPFLHLERFFEHFEDWVKYLPNFNEIRISSNFTIPNQVNIFKELFSLIEKYSPQQKFTIDGQISIDGPAEITDQSRGKGVTEAVLKNFNDLCKLNFNTNKICFKIHTKPTFSKNTLFNYFNDEKNIYNWYKFFAKEMYEPYIENNCKWEFYLSSYTLACPQDWTPEDGKQYSQILTKIINTTEKIKKDFPCWRRHISLIPEVNLALRHTFIEEKYSLDYNTIKNKSFFDYAKSHLNTPTCGGHCGASRYGITLIPKNKFTVCHRGIFDSYVDYCNNLSKKNNFNGLCEEFYMMKDSSKWVFDKEQFIKLYNTLGNLCHQQHQVWSTDLIITLQEYAHSGIIDEKYKLRENILSTLPILLSKSQCIQDNFILTGSWITSGQLEVPLLYNGAMDIILNEINQIYDKKLKEERRLL